MTRRKKSLQKCEGWGCLYPAVFGVDDEFVSVQLSDLSLHVGLLLIRDPDALLT